VRRKPAERCAKSFRKAARGRAYDDTPLSAQTHDAAQDHGTAAPGVPAPPGGHHALVTGTETHAPDPGGQPTISARFADGPLAGRHIAADVVEGRPPKTLDVLSDDGAMCRYCLAEWKQSGPRATYTFLYNV
jgi:hypothetical protein